ncbi:ubiquinol oxidase subunit II [Sphingomonas mollis]|uniref:Ubiquinol oxidase polypeptide II n=1 Tax=Sphingomonas mollis TaxID=2795726 RepID=A0ABS0XKA5_9SPHN|nr:ubiquinol oxidase subunit II [Sphingomonas sp. BT553]MBJ6120469.1 ubiquinol oxidase subunit II [Sphingomonas sp. BT553]
MPHLPPVASAARVLKGRWAPLALLALLPGCNMVVMNPSGDVALQQRDLILISVGLMLLIVIPVMVATVVFAWRYRAGNKDAAYDPDFDHSTMLELGIWSAPLLIIIFLGAVTWSSTHLLDPYRPIDRLKAGQPLKAGVKPLEVQVVALDWKWLFIYPELGIATVNELAAPVDRPITFRITASSVMNSFYIPALAGQIYAMPGMETKLHAVLNEPGTFDGIAAHYSGAGFSDMKFKMLGMDQSGFAQWVERVKADPRRLDASIYTRLEKPTEKVPVIRFATVEDGLFGKIVNRCVEPGKPCMSDMMGHDRRGGGDPHSMRPGSGSPPVNDAAPMHGDKAEGALLKDPGEKGTSPHQSKERLPGSPGNAAPGNERNRDMTALDPRSTIPHARAAGAADRA